MTDRYVVSIDQGTASSRCLVFDSRARIVSVAQKEHRHHYPMPGWVEHDPGEIWRNVVSVVDEALQKANLSPTEMTALGIANQRETTVLWNRGTGKPVHNAITWEDTRTDRLCQQLADEYGQKRFREKTGLPVSTYFSGPKVRWLLDHVPGIRERAEEGEVLFGTMDSWLLWNLCGRHVTDVTNASRTLLMDLETLDWDDELLSMIGVPRAMLPEIRPSSEIYGEAAVALAGVPVASVLGDQHAALVGQNCFNTR
jgi:glycerol kinase